MTARNPYRAAGTFIGDAYVEREADRRLQKELADNQRYPFFCAPRQNGKSSLIANTMQRLPKETIRCVLVDLSPFAVADYLQFMSDFLEDIARQAQLPADDIQPKYPEDTFSSWLRSIEQRIVVFIDEVDKLYQAPFREQFLSKIRSLFNKRAERNYKILNELQFVLSGAVHPTRLIPSEFQSPFNIGIEIRLSELKPEEVATLAGPLCATNPSVNQTELGQYLHLLTSGHVYLSQLILEQLWDRLQKFPQHPFKTHLDQIAHEIVVQSRRNIHFTNIFNQIVKDKGLHENFLRHYAGRELSEEVLQDLVIAGISDRDRPIRNELYRRVFGPRGPLELISAVSQPTRASLRRMLHSLFRQHIDLQAFCLDYFRPASERMVSSMSMEERINLLFELTEPSEIVTALEAYSAEKFAEYRHLLVYDAPPIDAPPARSLLGDGNVARPAPADKDSGPTPPHMEISLKPYGLARRPAPPAAPSPLTAAATQEAVEFPPPSVRDTLRVPAERKDNYPVTLTGDRIATRGTRPLQPDEAVAFLSLLKERDQIRQREALSTSEEDVKLLKRQEESLTQQIQRQRESMRRSPTLQADEFIAERYRLMSQLGVGGLGTVWNAHDYQTDRIVAIKILHPHLAVNARTLERFVRGARQMARLVHPNIVRVLDGPASDQNFHYYVMEYINGENLEQAVRRHHIQEEFLLPIIFSIGNALTFAHERGIIHRDVKPSNILLNEEKKGFLTDFDLVLAVDTFADTRSGAMGTLGFASPEMMENASSADARSDVYGLAMSAIFILRRGQLRASMLYEHAKIVDELLAPEALKSVLRRATAIDPEQRYKTISEFGGELEDAWYRPSPREQGAPVRQSRQPSRRWLTQVSGWAVLNVAAVLALLFGVKLWSSTNKLHNPAVPDLRHPEIAILSQSTDGGPMVITSAGMESMGVRSPGGLRSDSATAESARAAAFKGMVSIPGGTFVMGSRTDDPLASANEQPAHQELVSGFYLDRTEVTVSAYADCVSDGACTPPGTAPLCNWGVDGRKQHPVNCVEWNQAQGFCKWAGRRLPTEVEWEYAARPAVGEEHAQPGAPAHLREGDLCWGRSSEEGTCGVAHYYPNPRGIYDLAGNVWEWTASPYRTCYAPSCRREEFRKVIRGGSWLDTNPSSVRATSRRWQPPATLSPIVGFRCARDSATPAAAPNLKAVRELTPGIISQIMAAAEANLDRCPLEAPDALIVLSVAVAPSGKVESAKVLGPLALTNTGKCVSEQMLALRFPPFTSARSKPFIWEYRPSAEK